MTYNQILENYFILAPLERKNKRILLCRNLISHNYDFFELNGDEYRFVSTDIENQLRKIYKHSNSDIYYYYLSQKAEQYKDEIATQFEQVMKYVEDSTKDLDLLTRTLIKSHISSVKIKFHSENNTIKETIDDTTEAYYSQIEHTIYINGNQIPKLHTLLHEVFHCISKSAINPSLGFIETINQSYYKAPSHMVCFKNGRGINEGATEFYTSKAMNESAQSYEPLVNLYMNIREACSTTSVDTFYFTNKPKQFKLHISNAFKYTNNHMVEKLLAQMDALHEVFCNSPDTNKSLNDIYSLTKECYKTLIDMYIHKFKYEKIKLNDKYLFDNFLSPFGFESGFGKKLFEEILPDLEIYLSLQQYFNVEDNETVFTQEQLTTACAKIITYVMSDKKVTGQMLPEELKTTRFYQTMLSEWECLDFNSNILTKEAKQKTLKLILSEEFLPKDPAKVDEVIEMVISDISFYEYSAHKYLPAKSLMSFLNKRPSYALSCFKDNPMSFMPNLVNDFSSRIKSKPIFLYKFIETIYKIDKDQALLIVENFYNRLTPKLQSNSKIINNLKICLKNHCMTPELEERAKQLIEQMENNQPQHNIQDEPIK